MILVPEIKYEFSRMRQLRSHKYSFQKPIVAKHVIKRTVAATISNFYLIIIC